MQENLPPVIKDEKLITPEYVAWLHDWILKNQKQYFLDPNFIAYSWCDFEYFNKTCSRRTLCMPNEIMLIDRLWEGKHCYVICKITPRRKGKDLFKVIEIDELERSSWRNGYFLLPSQN